ncbi:hypothetical protein HZZ02_08355 [Streptococcus danieliae]|nr:hypothetical protein [Streptococcus danieliae]
MSEEQQRYADKLKKMGQEASELLTSYKYDEAKDVMKKLSNHLKQADDMNYPKAMAEGYRSLIKNFFFIDREIFNLKKRSVGIGHKLSEF